MCMSGVDLLGCLRCVDDTNRYLAKLGRRRHELIHARACRIWNTCCEPSTFSAAEGWCCSEHIDKVPGQYNPFLVRTSQVHSCSLYKKNHIFKFHRRRLIARVVAASAQPTRYMRRYLKDSVLAVRLGSLPHYRLALELPSQH